MIVSVMPTIKERRESRQLTIDQLAAIGIDPIIYEQDEDLPLCGASNLITTRHVIETALLLPDCSGVLLVEDDIFVDPKLGIYLDFLPQWNEVISLWHRPRFEPKKWRNYRGPFNVVEAIDLAGWFSTLGIYFPLDMAEAFCTVPPQRPDVGSDIHLKELLPRLGRSLYITLPSLVEHRPGKRYATRSGMYVKSEDFRGPVA